MTDAWVTSRSWRGRPLTIDQAVRRYLNHIADGPECAVYLRELSWTSPDKVGHERGFDSWCAMFRWSHERNEREGVSSEWDSRDYTDDEMRQIYDGIILHASRSS